MSKRNDQGGWPDTGFSGRLKEIRKEAGLTQEELAHRAGCSKFTVAKLEAGQQVPSWPLVLLLAAALEAECAAFISEEFRSRFSPRPHKNEFGKLVPRVGGEITPLRHENELGKLVPQDGSEVIPLRHRRLVIGRRDTCDIRLPSPNVSALHCELTFERGCWIVEDFGSMNGIRVNGEKTDKKTLAPGDLLSIAKHEFEIQYETIPCNATIYDGIKIDEPKTLK